MNKYEKIEALAKAAGMLWEVVYQATGRADEVCVEARGATQLVIREITVLLETDAEGNG